ncbi:type I pullulanase [Aquibacillus kalidii]|uniref:type I pullulanase n=1 Tax=Aquibacillus kalidii TaxID=2762597 RepID=UPI001644CA4C|nr:type I pullulanase [Aquibacillus kalidii]
MKRSYAKMLSLLMIISLVFQMLSAAIPTGIVHAEEDTVGSPVINEDGSVTFNYVSKGESAVYLNGDFVPDWDVNQAIEMELKDGIFTTTVPDLAPGDYQYKFMLNDLSWEESSVDTLNENQENGNSILTIPGTSDEEVSITSPIVDQNGNVTFNYDSQGETAVYVVGSFNNWNIDTAVEMELKNGIYSTTISDLANGSYEYKFVQNKRSWDESIKDPANPNSSGDNSVFTVERLQSPIINGDGSVTFNYKQSKDEEESVYVIGSLNGWDTAKAVEMTLKDGVFSATVSGLEPGEYEYKFLRNERAWNGQDIIDPLNPNEKNGNSSFRIKSSEPVTIESALMDSLSEILVTTNKAVPEDVELSVIEKETGTALDFNVTSIGDKSYRLTLADDESVDIRKIYEVSANDTEAKTIVMRNVLNDDKFFYSGEDLGYTYSPTKSTFKLWAPTATKVSLALYDEASSYEGAFVTDHTGGEETVMSRADNGVWSLTADGDLKNKYYMYKVEFANGDVNYAVDPYARSTSANGQRSAIVDLDSTDPAGFDPMDKPTVVSPSDAIIYELHVRDFSIDENSGMTNKGKYLAFTEQGTTGPSGVKTGVDSLKELGVNYVHLLPTYDFGSVNELTVEDPESTDAKYNWGYDPVNFNVPEGSYSTDPTDPTSRIKEYKQMVQALHDNGIRVIADVVYNHTYENESTQLPGSASFNKIVPNYYYRSDDAGVLTNGSGTGNEVASERPMVRKYIKDSVNYWATEYGVDGFRFDLMGLIDKQTMQELTKELRNEVDPNVLIYGEPWTGGSSALPSSMQHVKGSQKDQGYAVFNDNLRGAIKGDSDGTSTGFATGSADKEADIVAGVKGAIDQFTNRPAESINYVTAHDNLNLWDKIMRVAGEDSGHGEETYDPHEVITEDNPLDNEYVKRSILANGIVLTSQGIPFLHAGEEILRSKYGEHNSYKSPDSINKIRWNLKANYQSVFDYYKGLIELRKEHAAFKMDSATEVNERLEVWKQEENVVAYQLKDNANNDTWKNIVVIYNANESAKDITLPTAGQWNVVVDDQAAGTEVIRTVDGGTVNVEGLSMMVLYDQSESAYTPEANSIEVNTDSFAINPGEEKGVTAYVKDQKGRVMLGETLTWTSSNPEVAVVSNGRVTGVSKGDATITVKSSSIETDIKVTVDQLVPNTIFISGNESVFETYSTQLTMLVKDQYNQVLLGSKVTWFSSDSSIATVNNSGQVTGVKPGSVTITAKSGDAIATFDMVVKENVKRYVRVKYVRPDGDFTGDFGEWNLWAWNTGVKNDQINFESFDGDTATANIEIAPETESIGFLIRKGTNWDTAKIPPDSDDHNVQIDPDAIITKVTVVTGVAGFTQVPHVEGPVLQNGEVTFYYRDEELFKTDEMDTIESVKVKVDGKEYEMEYSQANEYFSYTLSELEEGIQAYTFLVTKDGKTSEVTDPYNTKDGKSVITYNRPDITIDASVSQNEISAGQSAVLRVSSSTEEEVAIKEISANLTALGGKDKIVIDQSVGAVSISASDTVTAGEKEIVVTVIDEYGNNHKKTVKITVIPKQTVGDELSFDWDEARIYFMLTDRFSDGDLSNNGGEDGDLSEYDPNHPEAFHGGDFQGIINKLDYIDDLGINTIWITPVVDNIDFNKGIDFDTTEGLAPKQYGYHGYWAEDFEKLDAHLGDINKFKELIEKAHDKGIKIMLDVVVNHAGYGMNGEFEETWNADAENLPTKEELANFDGMLRTEKDNIEGHEIRGELDGLPDFKTEDPEVRQQLVEWQTAWLNRARTDRGDTIDFFRIDTVKHVDDATWQALKNGLTEIDPKFKMIGEYWGASVNNDGGYLGTGQMDSLLDFDFKEKAKAFVDGDIDGVETYLQERNGKLDNTATLGQFLSSHDQNGFLTEYVGGDVAKLKVAAALQITAKGQPVIYYGEELGRSGKSDWEKDGETILNFGQNRADMPWELYGNQDTEAMALHNHYTKLLNIRADYSIVFSKGTRSKVAGSNEVGYTVFSREYDGESVYVGLNTKDSIQKATFKVDYPANTIVIDQYSGVQYQVSSDQEVTVEIPTNSSGGTLILALDPIVQPEPEQPGEGGGETPTTNPNNGNDEKTPTTPTTSKPEQPKKEQNPVVVKSKVKNGKATVDNKVIEKVKEDTESIVIEVDDKKVTNTIFTLTKENIELLKDKGIERVVLSSRGLDTSISIPVSQLPDGADVEVKRLKDSTDKRFVSGIYDFTIKVGNATLHQFDEPLQLEFKVDPKTVNNPDNLKAVYFNENTEKWEIVPGATYANGVVTVSTDHLSIYSVVEVENEEEVENLVAPSNDKYELPDTATSIFNWIILGLILILLGGSVFIGQRRKNA